MPGRDGTGPIGIGSMTGRGMGNCAGNGQIQGNGNRRGMCRGNGQGYGVEFKNSNNLSPLPQDELTLLKQQENILENTLNNVKGRISQLEQK